MFEEAISKDRVKVMFPRNFAEKTGVEIDGN